MDVRCIHFCEAYRSNPQTRNHDLIGIFNTLRAPSFPWRHVFWLCVELGIDEAERRFRLPVAIRTTGPNGGSGMWQEHIEVRERRGVHRPHVTWASRIDAEFDQPGYYHYEVLIDETEAAADKILVRQGHPFVGR